ncbi:MAG: AAA family ATPase [Chlamydiae bacterium]|nr:AAA family ATPase [Chlamydiota bacterium]
MIAGPNGAGKTTTALTTLPELKVYEFLNADEIAKGLAPLNPESVPLAASKLLIKRFRELLDHDKSFTFETTAAGKNYIKYLEEARRKGYEIHLLFLWLHSPELAIKRVAQRVKQGGHNIPKETIRGRYFAGLRNLFMYYLKLADSILILDNSFDSQRIIARKNSKDTLHIKDKPTWLKMQELANG